jgi:carboxypeptidase family protein/TonB-dependent receptor-like protein
MSIVLGWFLSCLGLLGQESLSTLRGTVTDVSGASVAGAEITATEVATNIKARVVTSDSQGNYEMPGLKAGRYQLRAVLAGFKTFVADDITLLSSQIRRVDVSLEVGGVETQVTVSEKSTAIETEQGKIAVDFTGARYKDIPIPGNRFSGTAPVLVVLPHVQGARSGGTGITFAGQRSPQLNMGMDGVKEETLNTQTVNLESVSEVKLVAVNNTAEFSRIGYFDAVTKRGGNLYHGELSYYQQNSALYARGFFERQKTWDLYHIFNIAASGPIIKEKTFFYALWNGERVPGKTFRTNTVPTEAMRGGDFSQLLSSSPVVTVRDPLNGQPFAGNRIPTSRLNAVSLKVQEQQMPRPNRGGAGSLVNNFDWVHPYPSDQFRADVLVTRVDHHFSSNNSLYGRFSAYLPRYITPGNYPTTGTSSRRQSHSWVFGDTHIFSPNMINTFTFGGNRDGRDVGIEINGYQPPQGAAVVADLGLVGLSPKVQSFGDKGSGFPIMDITGFSTITTSHGGRSDPWHFTFADAITRSSPRHVLKFGGELRTYRDFNGLVPDATYGRFTFDGSLTGSAYADFLLGLPFRSERLDPIVDRYRNSKELGLFITDTFKVTNRLNIDFGLRWDYYTSTTFEDGLMFNWDRATGNIIVPQEARDRVRSNYPANIGIVTGDVVPRPERGNFAPRVAIAYRLTDRTVFRGGYGIFTEFFGKWVRAEGGGPFQIGDTYFNAIQNGQPLLQFPNPFPGAGVASTIPSQSANGYPSETTNGYIQQFNLTLEQQLRDVGVRLSYVGSRNIGINYNLAINKPLPSLTAFSQARRPYPQFVGINYPQTDGRQNYDSFTLEAKRRTGWVTFDGAWTWAHNMLNYLNLENPYDHHFWNRDDSTARHRVVINSLFEVPVGRGKPFLASMPGALNHAIGGWKLAWIAFLQTGQFFSPSFSGSDPSRTNTSGGLPDRTCNGNFPAGGRSIGRWFDQTCFSVPPAGRFGNSGMHILEGPGLHSHNMSITKRFPLTERLQLDYMATISNIFNHPNFEFPGSNISVPGQVGIITAQHNRFRAERSGARFIDMRLRLEF